MHALFIYNYLQFCKAQTIPLLAVLLIAPYKDPPITQRGSGWRLGLVDPRQLFHNLNDLVHCGFTLHAAAVIDL